MRSSTPFKWTIEAEQEDDGRSIAEIVEIPGVLAYSRSRDDAVERVIALAAEVIDDRLKNGESVP